MKICYVPTLNTGVVFWRIENYAQALLAFKDECRVHVNYIFPHDSGLHWEFLIEDSGQYSQEVEGNLIAAFQHFDVIIFQKMQHKSSNALIDRLKKEYPDVKVLVDIDDHIGDLQPSNRFLDKTTSEHQWTLHQINKADAVLVSTHYLKSHVMKLVAT